MTGQAYQPVRQRAGRFACAHPDCELRYNDRGARLACCAERPLPGDAIADGRHPAIENSRVVALVRGLREVLIASAAIQLIAVGSVAVWRGLREVLTSDA